MRLQSNIRFALFAHQISALHDIAHIARRGHLSAA